MADEPTTSAPILWRFMVTNLFESSAYNADGYLEPLPSFRIRHEFRP